MGEITVLQALAAFKDAGLIGVLVFALFGGYKRIWVWGYQLDECKEREQAWRAMALRNGGVADRTLEIATTK